MKRIVAAIAFAGTMACSSGTGSDAPSFSLDIQPIFSTNCASSGCHISPNAQQGMNLGVGQSYRNIVGVPSVELPSMDRVSPGHPTQSYLIHKIEGTQASVGGSGARMPDQAPPLQAIEIATIRAWIDAGAPNN